ncbi:potassium-transporting ATPase subunit KdpB [Limnobacter litoralis]|uniref:Potassium-transporting ATPase ATP-binding subunit n=1 Tax=Limnobacter litoralis TaxID=481366 RepID=A0ABQ5YRH9_9BURK|nr:potassium-transporting ATPase subunit KdpB [Limnobacter litoralis]GLR27083.1 potassium-transporting ATPase ATP-binding subunit [Limnobacter litoralis]
MNMRYEIALETFRKLSPTKAFSNPVMAIVWIGTWLSLLLAPSNNLGWAFGIAVFVALLTTVLFANFAEAVAEARGRGQARALREARKDLMANVLLQDGSVQIKPASALQCGDRVRVSAGEQIPADGEIVQGCASISEAAVTGESAPVLREAETDRSGVIGGTLVMSDQIDVEITAAPGDSFLDRMISLVEGANRQKTPNEIALGQLLIIMTLTFLIVVLTLPFVARQLGLQINPLILIALLVCLIPTTISGLLPAIGIAGMNRALKHNVLAKSGKAVEVAGDLDVLMLDKTGTITHGDRMATRIIPLGRYTEDTARRISYLTSAMDPTPEGKSIVTLAGDQAEWKATLTNAEFLPFSATTRMSGLNLSNGVQLRKGAADSITAHCAQLGGRIPPKTESLVEEIARAGGTPLLVCEDADIVAVIELSDVVKPGIQARFARLRSMGIRTVMITGDNPLTAAAIAAKAGVDDYMAQARPEDKLARIREEQAAGHLVAMVGDGTNDAPALAQADIGLAMNSGTQAAREAGNMVDLDSNPTKLLEVVEIGKQQLITRGALTTFSLANDVSKYFAILPVLFVPISPGMASLNVMHLASTSSAVLSALIFNAIVIPLLIPLALKGVPFVPGPATNLLRRNMLVYGAGGVLLPFIGIKLIDLALQFIRF